MVPASPKKVLSEPRRSEIAVRVPRPMGSNPPVFAENKEAANISATEIKARQAKLGVHKVAGANQLVHVLVDKLYNQMSELGYMYIVPPQAPKELPWKVTPFYLRWLGKPTFRRKNIWHPLARKGLFHWPGHRWEYEQWPGDKK